MRKKEFAMSEAEKLLSRQAKLAADIETFLSNVKKATNERYTSQHIKNKHAEIDELWAEFESNNEKLKPHKDPLQPYFDKKTYNTTKDNYVFSLGVISAKSWQFTKTHPGEDGDSDDTPEKEKLADVTNTLKINEIHLNGLFTEIEAMDLTTSSMGAQQMRAEDLRRQFNDWKTAFIDVQRHDMNAYDGERYTKYHKKYIKVCSKLQDAINVAKKANDGATNTDVKNTAELPKIKIPDFDGAITKWKVFYELFNQVIHQNTSLGNAAKMHFLKTYVKGEAARLINHLPSTAENYDSAYKILIARYENTRILLGKLLDTLLEFPPIESESCKSLKQLHDTVFECLAAIGNLNVETQNWDALITHILAKKLDNETRKGYECQLKNPKEPQKTDDLLKYIEARFMALESYGQEEPNEMKPTVQKNSPQSNKMKKIQQKCSYCSGQHTTAKCDTFLKLNEHERYAIAKEKKWCMNCLRDNHKTSECKVSYKCDKCQKLHHTTLHLESFKKNDKKSNANAGNSSHSIQSMVANNQIGVLLATAVINVHSVHGTPLSFRALIDQGSQSAFITENAAQTLCLPRKKISAMITGIGQQIKNAKHSVKLTITPRMASNFILHTQAVVLEKLSTNATSKYNSDEWSHINQLQLADPAFYEQNQIDIHLGAAEYAKIIKNGLVKGDEGTPIAQNTELGWIVSGNLHKHTDPHNISIQSMISTTEVNDFLKKFWEINEIEHHTPHTQEERQCEEIFENTTKRMKNGKYMVHLPLRDGKMDLGQSRNTAVATFLQLERKFSRNNEYFLQYKQFIDEYATLGHMIEARENADVMYYLPHHAVFKDSSTTKLRVVFDASRKSSNQKSLNDNLLIGPTIQQDMSSIIMRWRKHRIAFTADIEKMYRQILVHPEHTDLQRIIWRNSPHEKLREYKLMTVTYGTSSAPYLAIRTLHQLARDEKEAHPEAAKIILNDFYVDDVATGADNEDQAKFLYQQLKQTLQNGGFNLRKWSSNSTELLRMIPECDREIKLHHDIVIESTATIKTLGIRWNPSNDSFGFKIRTTQHETTTKRELLSEIASLFDPLGWLAPVIVKAKILIQESWSSKIAWDDKLPMEIKNNWEKIKNELPMIEGIEIPRWLRTCESTTIQLHGFCDASESAYAAVIYIRTVDDNENVSVQLLTAKTKVAPLKKEKLTIPRLELCGATLLANLAQQVISAMQLNIENIFLWCDSRVVLAWIQGNPNRWKSFVANRAIEINGKFHSNRWNYVQSKQNPADCASRGIFPSELNDHELWWNGPNWLREKHVHIERAHGNDSTSLPEEKTIVSNVACVEMTILPIKKTYTALQRIIALCLRFISNCKMKKRNGAPITADEYRRSSYAITYAVQRECFTSDINRIMKGKELKENSAMRKLNPFIDETGLLRVGGRLMNAALKHDAKHQLLLPYEHFVTQLLIKKVHIECMHGGPMLTESLIRQRYWIIKGYRRIKKAIFECDTCRRYSRSKMQQFMGDLPRNRVVGIRAFINCGVDYAGPIAVRACKGRGYRSVKGYIAVFVCLATKAIHLECVSDMTTDAFLAAFKRFTARRGAVSNIYSDNGTNFVGANNILNFNSAAERHEYKKTIFAEMAKIETTWHFIPPASPNFGGLWEAGVKSVKTHMKKTIGDSTLTFEELSTLLCQIEATLNSRPLCALSSDANDTATLTPGHFLIGSALQAPPETNFLDVNANRLSRWQLIQKMHQNFWKRWSTEYLNRLQERPKWLKKINEPEINDLVLLKEENLPPARWASGRIVRKHPGQDGLTRVVEVKIDEKVYKRPLSKICTLPAENDDEATASGLETTQNIVANSAFIKRKRGTRLAIPLMFIMMAYAITITQTAPAEKFITVTPFTYHPGIYFENHGIAYLSSTKWNILAYYDLRHHFNELEGIRKSIKRMKGICSDISTNNTLTDCTENIMQLEERYEEINGKNEIIGKNRGGRQRRATLNFVGNILSDVFGVLDSKFAEEYERDLSKISRNEEHLLLLMKNHTTIAETTLNIIRRNEDVIAAQTERINGIIYDIQRLSNDEEKINKLTDATFHILLAMTKYEATQASIVNAILDVHNGVVSSNIISPQQLKAQLQKIHATIDSSILVPGEDAHDELRSLYSIMRIQATTVHDQVVFKIILPLILNQQFQVFKLISVPTLHEGRYIWFVPNTPILLTTIRRTHYYPMSDNDLHECNVYGANAIICEHKNVMHMAQTTQLGCEIQFLNHGGNLSGNCTFKTTPVQDTWIALHEPNKWVYVIYDIQQMDVICNNQLMHHQISGEGIIELQPHCSIKHAMFEITAQNNYENAISASILPELNIATEIEKYRRSRDPKLLIFNKSNMTTLDEMIQTTKGMEKQLPEQLSGHDLHHYGLGYTLVFIVLAYIIFRFIHYRKTNGQTIDIQMEPRRAVRPISMPDLRRENVQIVN